MSSNGQANLTLPKYLVGMSEPFGPDGSTTSTYYSSGGSYSWELSAFGGSGASASLPAFSLVATGATGTTGSAYLVQPSRSVTALGGIQGADVLVPVHAVEADGVTGTVTGINQMDMWLGAFELLAQGYSGIIGSLDKSAPIFVITASGHGG